MTTRDDAPAPLPDPIPEPHTGLMGRFRNYFLTGLVVTGPIAITLYLVWWFVTWVDGVVRPFIPLAYRPETYMPYVVPGWGLIVAVFTLTLLGFLTANLIGRTLVDLGETFVGRIPAVRAIYRGLKQVFETLFSGKGSSFRKVGLVEFPSPGMWSIVLISQSPNEDVARSLPGQEEHVSVFLPCSPNPTTGFFFYVPRSKIIEVDMSTEDAATLIMSAGVVQPGSAPDSRKAAALAGMANAARIANASTSRPEPAKVE
ncbi:putative membrane protein [Bradyrhizobium sp. LM2.7]